jgi:hypothetical protein
MTVCANHPEVTAKLDDYLCEKCRDKADGIVKCKECRGKFQQDGDWRVCKTCRFQEKCEYCKKLYLPKEPGKNGIRFAGLCWDCKDIASQTIPLKEAECVCGRTM